MNMLKTRTASCLTKITKQSDVAVALTATDKSEQQHKRGQNGFLGNQPRELQLL
jgi:hypothetical protein